MIDAKEAFALAKDYMTKLAPDEAVPYSVRESYYYYIIDFMPGYMEGETPETTSAQGTKLGTKDGYTCITYGQYGPVVVTKRTGECATKPKSDKDFYDYYHNLFEHSKMLKLEDFRN